MDYFQDLTKVPHQVREALYNAPEEPDYMDLFKLQNKLLEYGWTFDYGLDAVPYDLRKLK